MANFQRKQNQFLHTGMDWNSPAEKLADGKVNWAKNVRVLERGTISSAHGYTLVYGPVTTTVGFPNATPAPGGGFYVSYCHSLQRLNILNTTDVQTSTGALPAYESFLRRNYVLGADTWLYVFQDDTTLFNQTINPVLTPGNPANNGTPDQNVVNPAINFSGNPLSIVDAMPVAGIVAWKYIADSNQMVTVGYYPGDGVNQTMARCLTIGLTPPVNTALPRAIVGGNLVGSYQWSFVYRRIETGARSNPSAATRASINVPGTTAGTGVAFKAEMLTPQTPIDPQTGLPDTNVVVDIYRFGGAVLRWALVGSMPGNTSFTDDLSDLNILAAASPSQATDPTTGLTRFNLFRPFVTQDIRRGGQGVITQDRPPTAQQLQAGDHGGPFIFTANEPAFKLDWLPGSTLNVDGTMLTIYQVLSETQIEIAEDLTGSGAAGGGGGGGGGGGPGPGTGFNISGSVTAAGAGATVVLSGAASAFVVAGSDGSFTLLDLANGTYTVTPSLSGVTFTPASATVTVSGANVTGVNFTTGAGGGGPNPNEAGPVGNFTISGQSVTGQTATATFSWTPPTVNPGLYAGVELWITSGAPVALLDSLGPGVFSAQESIQITPNTLGVTAITIDSAVGRTDDPNNVAFSPGVDWVTEGGNPGKVANFVLVSQSVNPDNSVTALFSWSLAEIIGTQFEIYFAGVTLYVVATTGSESVPFAIGGASGLSGTSASASAPASAVGETWTVAAITYNTVGQLGDDPTQYGTAAFQAQTVDWTISSSRAAAIQPRAPRPPVPQPGGAAHDWETPAGTLLAGQPLPHLWGVFGIGQGGSYIFGCGDPNAPSTLYWTNGNDPDSTDIVNTILVTNPSEKLQTGCIYAGQSYCWTTERMFQIMPSLTVFGQFTTQEQAGARGCWLEWSLSVQNNGFADLSVTWRGKDGIYDYSVNAGLQRLSDPLYAFFPHDGTIGLAPETIIDAINGGLVPAQFAEHVGNIDDTQPQYHRTCWFQGLLFYDFVALTENPDGSSKNTFSTLVWDSVNIPGGGWVSLDQNFSDTGHPVARSVESGATDLKARDDLMPDDSPLGPFARGGNMKSMWGPNVYDYFGYQRGFESRIITRAEDLGDSRAPKLWGDFWIDCVPLDTLEVTPIVDFNKIYMTTLEVPPPGLTSNNQRQEFVMDFPEFYDAGGKGLLNPTLGLDIRWQNSNNQFAVTLYQWQCSYIVKPEFMEFRATDRDDRSAVQAKYLMACNMEANTLGKDVTIDVWVDGILVQTWNVNHDFQSEKPYAINPPVAGYEFQVQLQASQPNTLWQLYQLNWIFEPWPDAVARYYPFDSLGTTADKFIQGIVLPMETNGEQATVGVWSDDDNVWRYWSKTTLPLKKTGVDLDISQPFTAHFIQFQTVTAHRIWPGEARVIWEPIPEATNTWQTQQTDNDLGGWSWLRDCFIAYMGGTGANLATPVAMTTPTLTITTEYGSMSYLLDPVAPNQYVRCYRVLAPQKAKWHQYRLDAPGPGVRLYQKDTVIRIKEWGSQGPFLNSQPFGDESRASGAKM